MKCDKSLNKTYLLMLRHNLNKITVTLKVTATSVACFIATSAYAVENIALNTDILDEFATVSNPPSLVEVGNNDVTYEIALNDTDIALIDKDIENTADDVDDDIDAIVDEDAFNDVIDGDLPENIDSDTIDDGTGFNNNIDTANNDIDAVPNGDLPNNSLNINNSINTNESLDTEPLDLTFEHVPLNAISPNTIQTFVEVIERVRQDYVRPVNDEILFQHAIAGMLEKLDNHAEYLTPENYDKLRNFTDGEIGQVGLSASYDSMSGVWVIDNVVTDSSASQAGIKVGDKLLRIKNIKLLPDMYPQDIEQLLSGIAGSQVQVTITTRGRAERNVTLQRNLSKNNELDIKVQEGIAIIRLPIFQNTTKDQLINSLRTLGVPISGVVLDVRNNPGGVLSSAIDVASLFIADSGLIQVKNRTNSSQIINPNGTPYLKDIPVIVLQNRYSASAAEVLSSSLKSNKRARIVGETSFGKGTVQEVVPLENGGAIKLTVAEYRDILGEPIDGVGIKPDIRFLHDGSDWQKQAVTLLVSQERLVDIQINEIEEDVPAVIDY